MTRKELTMYWGMEVILRCDCGDVRSHRMDGKAPTCPKCRKKTEILYGANWETILENNK